MFWELLCCDITFVAWKAFSQKTCANTISSRRRLGNSWNVVKCRKSCAFFDGPDVAFYSGTCSLFDTMFNETTSKIDLGSKCSNSPLPSICVMRKPKCVYILTLFLRALYIDLWVQSGIACAEPNCIFLDIVVKKVMALMYIISIVSVISLYCSGVGVVRHLTQELLFSSGFFLWGRLYQDQIWLLQQLSLLVWWDS